MASTKYLRVCADCGNTKEITYRPKKGTLCPSCRAKGNTNNKKPEGTHVRYWYFCSNCPDVVCRVSKRKGTLCKDCSSSANGKANKGKERKLPPPRVRHYRICPECPEDNNTKRVNRKRDSGVLLCKRHAAMSRNKPTVIKPQVKKKSKILSDSAKAILKAEREEAQRIQDKKKEFPVTSESDSKRMQEEFLQRRNDETK